MRFWAALWAFWILLGGWALCEGARYVIDAAGVAALTDAGGAALLEDVETLYAVREGSLYAAGSAGELALYDGDGHPLGEARFDMIADMGDALIFRRDGRYGAMDAAGKVLAEAEWTQLVPCGADAFLALEGDPDDDAADPVLGLRAGVAADTGYSTLTGLRPFADGRMPFCDGQGRWGCLDMNGALAIPCAFDWIGDYLNGAAIAAKDGRYGMLDANGSWIAEPDHTWMDRGDGIVAGLSQRAGLEVWDSAGRLLYAIPAGDATAEIVGDCVALRDGDALRVYNARGRNIYALTPEALVFPGAGGQLIAAVGPWGSASQWLVDPSGVASEARFQRLLPLCADRYGFMTMQGAEYYSEDLNSLQISWDYASARWGLIDGKSRELLPAEYREIRLLNNDRLLLVSDGAVTFADVDGTPIRVWQIEM